MPIGLFVANTAMLAAAVLAELAALGECRRRIIRRWRLLMPGLLGALSTAMLVAYPELRDLLEPERWTVGTAAFLVGATRGALIGMSSDRVFRLVRLRNAADGAVVAAALVMFAAFEFAAEIQTASESRFEPTIEALMTLSAGYLAGRSVAAWFQAVTIPHYDLGEE
jgi:fluoride ion exporter CrcB/FEX